MKNESRSPIQDFYNGKTIFLTGVTGFLGKVLLEKLLRCCPGIHQIYLLIREKKGKTLEERIQQLCGIELFDTLKKQNPGFQKKLIAVDGDLGCPLLGISDVDLEKLANNVNIIFHSAARLGFDDKLRHHVQDNLIATSVLLDIAKEFKNLEAFIYISTAFVHIDPDSTVPECVVKKSVSPKQLIDALQWMDDDMVNALCSTLMKKEDLCPYFMTKALAENVVEDFHNQTTTAIVKCGYVLPMIKDPIPGWCDALQGVQGIVVAIAKGFLRAMYVLPNKAAVIPVDVLSNSIIATAWHVATTKPSKTLVVNSTLESEEQPIFGDKLMELVLRKVRKYPAVKLYRYPSITVYQSYVLYALHTFIDHYIPAMIIDFILYLCTGRTIMIRLYKRSNFLVSFFNKGLSSKRTFKMNNYHIIRDRLSAQDADTFLMNVKNIDWDEYLENVVIVGRKILLKEDPSNINYARKKAKVWLYVTTLLKWMLLLYFFRSMYLLLFGISG